MMRTIGLKWSFLGCASLRLLGVSGLGREAQGAARESVVRSGFYEDCLVKVILIKADG